jgi:hypothetical protein
MIQMVLATDMKAHFDILSQFRSQVGQSQSAERTHENLGSWWHELFPIEKDASFSSTSSSTPPPMAYPLEYRRTILKTALHVSDVSNPARVNALTVKWADLVQEEFFLQGDLERAAGLPISMFMDRSKPAFPKMQVGFIEFIVKPLIEAFYGWLKSLRPFIEPHLTANLEYWKKRLEAELSGSSPSVGAVVPTLIAMQATPPGDTSRVTNRFVARLKSGPTGSSRHRATASIGELTLTSTVTESPSAQGTRKPTPIRRTTSETLSLGPTTGASFVRKGNVSPVIISSPGGLSSAQQTAPLTRSVSNIENVQQAGSATDSTDVPV